MNCIMYGVRYVRYWYVAVTIYRRQLATLDGKGVLFAIVNDIKIAGPPIVIAEIIDSFSDVAWNEAGLTT